MTRGTFITFEGGEGAGKSTQVRRLGERLRGRGVAVVETREPGGTAFADRLRDVLLAPALQSRSALAEALTFYAARADHIASVVEPALRAGTWVISDRFSDSTSAYQGAAGGVSPSTLAALEALVVGADTRPALTVLIDLDPAVGLERAGRRPSAADAFESRDLAFHQRLREGFLAIARNEPDRVVIIDGAATIDAVAKAVWDAIETRLPVPEDQ